MGLKCFLVEETGNVKEVECEECKGTPEAHTSTEKEYRRTDTGETWWGWWASKGPGSIYITSHEGYPCWCKWTNCNGKHIEVITPDGHCWDASSRASNCTMKEEGTHRCWILHGTPPNLTADKNGYTCQAGAGSIQSPGWHGFLQNGELNPC